MLITYDIVLTHFNPSIPIRPACDVSPYGIGFREGTEKPIAFASRSLTATERNYAQIDREALMSCVGCKKSFTIIYVVKGLSQTISLWS